MTITGRTGNFIRALPLEKYFVTEKHTGLGSDIASIVGSWYYAKITGRSLVIDWRSSLYCDSPEVNAFTLFFKPVEELFGVRVICDRASSSFLSLGNPLVVENKDEPAWTQLQRGTPLDQQVIINRAPSRLFPSLGWQYNILKCLVPNSDIERQIMQFQAEHTSPLRKVGIHLRHGNGEDIDRIDGDLEAFTDKYIKAIDDAGIRDQAVFLVCTDSAEVLDMFEKKLNNVITFKKDFKEAGTGPLHLGGDADVQVGYDAISEMILLARCDALLHNLGWFSYYAQVVLEYYKKPIIRLA